MATIRPFLGLRYSAQAGALDDLVAPPYDVLSQAQRDALAAKNENNIVALTLPEQNKDDRSKYIKYARSSARLEAMKRDGVLVKEAKPAFYRYRQTFTIPGSTTPFERLSLIVTLKVEPYEKNVVLPHEQTFPKHKEDRLRILEATRSHLECIYGLMEDEDKAFYEAMAHSTGAQVADVTTDDGVRHIVDLIDDSEATATLEKIVEKKKIWIADGHHRYETALTFRQAQPDTDSIIAEDFMMIALSSISDPGLVLLPTHRMIKKLNMTQEEMLDKLRTKFELIPTANTDLSNELEKEAGNLQDSVFGLALPGGLGYIIKTKQPSADRATSGGRLARLDVTVLHDLIFTELLGLSGVEFFDYTRDPDEAIAAVENGSPATFLMNPPTVDDMQVIALGGDKMPQKSTFYYPKILSGLVLWSLNDFA